MMVTQIIRYSLSAEEQAQSRVMVHAILAEAAKPNDVNEINNWSVLEDLRPHLEPSGALRSAEPAVRQLVLTIVRFLRVRGDARASQELAEQTLDGWQGATDDVEALMMRHELAAALREQGQYRLALDIEWDVRDRFTRPVERRPG